MERSTVARLTTRPRPHLVEEEGIEPPFTGCRPAVLPLDDSPGYWLRAGELNATRMAYEASMTPVHLPAETPGAPCQTRTDLSGLQIRRIAIYAYRAKKHGAGAENRTPFVGQAARSPANRPHPRTLSKIWSGGTRVPPASIGKQFSHCTKSSINTKRAAILVAARS